VTYEYSRSRKIFKSQSCLVTLLTARRLVDLDQLERRKELNNELKGDA
tara:strand:- start:554 stop:697 length:144 start_codon:yes stop_codon:yes gene_type:complete